jgi:hypothetical protein
MILSSALVRLPYQQRTLRREWPAERDEISLNHWPTREVGAMISVHFEGSGAGSAGGADSDREGSGVEARRDRFGAAADDEDAAEAAGALAGFK